MKIFMRIMLVGLLAIFFTQNSFADDYDFRKTKWGMSAAQVKSSESLAIADENKKTLMYKTNILNKNVVLLYQFIDNQLVSAVYLLKETHTNKNNFITDYNDFKKTLTKKYGKPKKDKIFWKNDLYKDDYSSWGMAISVGHLIYSSGWETEDTEIMNTLIGENYKITFGVSYYSKKLKELTQKADEKEALDAL